MRALGVHLVLLLLTARGASGVTNLNGRWGVRAEPTSPPGSTIACLVDITQSGTEISFASSCNPVGAVTLAGTIDPAAGTFTASGHSETFCSSLTIGGRAAPDGTSFAGTFSCDGPYPTRGIFLGDHCGNGVLDPGEACDDGNVVDGDCCSSSCNPERQGSLCPNDDNLCTDAVCDGAGHCVHPPRSGPCDDGNECTAADTCVDGACAPGTPTPAGAPCGPSIDLCGTSRCDGVGACIREPAPDGVACNDGDACTTGDACRGGSCVGGSSVSCGSCHVCDPEQGCLPVRGRGCPRPRRPRKVHIDCHDGTIENRPDPLCDVDRTADGTCTFVSPCPLCRFSGCGAPCFEEPSYAVRLAVGDQLVFKRRGRRPGVRVRCLPPLAG